MNQLVSSVIQSLFAEQQGKNWVFSPASYLEAMASLAVCSKGSNLDELKHTAPDILEAHAIGLETYNCLLCSATYHKALVESVLQTLKARGSDLKTFVDPSDAVAMVNAIVNEKTHGKIPYLLSPSDASGMLTAIILNCVYFKQSWLHRFDQRQSAQTFSGATETTQVRFLYTYLTGQRYYEDSQVDIVEVSYKESDVCCYLIVPKTNLFEVFNVLSSTMEKLALVANVDGRAVDLTVPEFKTESVIQLGGATANAGVQSIFSHTKDWSFLDFDKLDPAALMWVSMIKQKAYLDFTAVGTEAAAATAILMYMSGCLPMNWTLPPPPKVVRADKPFLYVLAHRSSPTKPLFIGVVNDVPSSPPCTPSLYQLL